MKRLCSARFTGMFCFVSEAEDDKLIDDAANHTSEIKLEECRFNVEIEDAAVVSDALEIPVEWLEEIPFNGNKSCEDFLEGLDEAKRIANKFRDLDYDLDDNFVEDLQKILNEGE